MTRPVWLLALWLAAAATAAPVPKEKAESLPPGAVVRLGDLRFRGPSTDGVTFSNDGKTLFALDRSTLHAWDATTGRRDATDLGVKGACGGFVSGDRVFVFRPVRRPEAKWDTFTVTLFNLAGKKLLDIDTKFHTRGADLSYPLDDNRVGVNYRAAGGRWLHGHTFRVDKYRVYDATDGTLAWQGVSDREEQLGVRVEFSDPVVTADGKALFGHDGRSVVRKPVLAEGKSVNLSTTTDVRSLALTPDGKHLLAQCLADEDDREKRHASGRVAVWPSDAEVPADNLGGLIGPTKEFPVAGPVWGFLPLGTGAVLVGRGASGRIDCYDTATGKLKWTADPPVRCGHDSWHPQLAATADGKRVAVSNGQCVTALLDGATGKRADDVPALDGEVKGVWYSADGKTITTVGDGGVRTWEAATGKPLAASHPKGEDWHRYTGTLAGVPVWMQFHYVPERGDNFRLTAWDVPADKPAWRFDAEFTSTSCTHAVFGDRLVLNHGAFGGEFAVYDERRKKLARWKVTDDAREGALDDGAVRVGDDLLVRGARAQEGANPAAVRLALADGKVVGRLSVPRGKRGWYDQPKATSADGTRVALFGRDGFAVVETAGGKLIAEIPRGVAMPEDWPYAEGNNGPSGPVAFSPDGKWLLAGDDDSPTVRLVDLADVSKPRQFCGTTAATVAAFSPDGKRVVVGYRDGTALIWDVSN